MAVKIRVKSTKRNTSVFLLTRILEKSNFSVWFFTIFLDKTSDKSSAGKFCHSSPYHHFSFFPIRNYEIGQYELLSNHNHCVHEHLIRNETCI